MNACTRIPAPLAAVSPLVLLALLTLARPVSAQVLLGRVVDAASGEGVPGAIVVAEGPDGDVSPLTLTRRDGEFTVRLAGSDEPRALRVERIGYAPQIFSRGEFSLDAHSVLRVSTAPIRLEGITASADNLCGADIRGDPSLYKVWLEVRKGLQTSQLSLTEQILTFDTESFERRVEPGTKRVVSEAREQRQVTASLPYRAISVEQMTDSCSRSKRLGSLRCMSRGSAGSTANRAFQNGM